MWSTLCVDPIHIWMFLWNRLGELSPLHFSLVFVRGKPIQTYISILRDDVVTVYKQLTCRCYKLTELRSILGLNTKKVSLLAVNSRGEVLYMPLSDPDTRCIFCALRQIIHRLRIVLIHSHFCTHQCIPSPVYKKRKKCLNCCQKSNFGRIFITMTYLLCVLFRHLLHHV